MSFAGGRGVGVGVRGRSLSAMRLFIGIALASDASDALARIGTQFVAASSDLRWSARESWHVTLQFLGKATAEQAACVTEQLRAVRAAAVPVRIDGLGLFERAGVFHAGVELTPEMLALQQRVVAATRGCGFLPEERAYHPHITLARVKGRGGGEALRTLRAAVERARFALHADFLAEEFLLYESVPEAGGSRYLVVERFSLNGGE